MLLVRLFFGVSFFFFFHNSSDLHILSSGLEDRIVLYRVHAEFASVERVLGKAPGINNPRIMVNDGCVAPNGIDIVCGEYSTLLRVQNSKTLTTPTTRLQGLSHRRGYLNDCDNS